MRRVLVTLIVIVPLVVTLAGLSFQARAGSRGSAAAVRILPCHGADLKGRFSVVRGSAGAGKIVYELSLHNRGSRDCVISGLPDVKLLDAHRHDLPTHVKAEFPNALTAPLIPLEPGGSAVARARFSPDVPGRGEPASGLCERIAHWMRVMPPGGGILTVRVAPPTPVCEHGTLMFSAFGSAR